MILAAIDPQNLLNPGEAAFWLALLAVFVAMVFFSTIVLLKSNYKRCSSNQVLVIFGKTSQGQAAKTVHGGAACVCSRCAGFFYI
jgi:flotillin